MTTRTVGSSSSRPEASGVAVGEVGEAVEVVEDRLAAVAEALDEARRLGFLGDRPIAEVIAHASAFVEALEEFRAYPGPAIDVTVIDIGSGGGVPGLVIAALRPDVSVTLADRRTKRTDFLARVIRRLGWQHHVSVLPGDLPGCADGRRFSVVVSRGFGPPESTLRTAADLVEAGGLIVISEPPAGSSASDRWQEIDVEALGCRRLARRSNAPTTAPVVGFRRL